MTVKESCTILKEVQDSFTFAAKEVNALVESIIADNIRRIIDSKGMKIRSVAKLAGFSEDQLSAILNQRRLIKDVDIVAIANALDVTPNELFGIDTE